MNENLVQYPELSEEIVKVGDYHSSEALKTDIRKIIDARQQGRWQLYEMISKGPFISLVFRESKSH